MSTPAPYIYRVEEGASLKEGARVEEGARVDEGARVEEGARVDDVGTLVYFGTLIYFGGCRILKRRAGEKVRLYPPAITHLNLVYN